MTITGIDTTNANMATKIGNPVIYNLPTPAVYASGNQTYLPSDVIGSILLHPANVASNGQLPAAPAVAALMRLAGNQMNIGDTVACSIMNNGTNVLTLVVGAGMSFDVGGNGTIPANSSKWCQFRFNSVTPGSETCVVYS
jgi:hypothetical protein